MLIGVDASRVAVDRRTGTENYSLYLLRALLALGGDDLSWRLYFREPPPEGLLPRGERIEWRVIPFPRLWTHLRLAWEVARHPPDVLFVPAHVLPLFHPPRCVATVHDLGYLYYPTAHAAWARRYLDWATRFNARVARRIIADSQATRDDLVRWYGVDPAKIVVAYPAGSPTVERVTDPQRLAAVQDRYGTGHDYYLHVGTLHPRKNLDTLFRAFASLVEKGILDGGVKLALVGKRGWLYDEILALAERPPLRGRVVLPGYVPTEDVAALMSGALAFVLPSWYEGFGLPVLEAMACQAPVICSNVSSLPEVAGDAALLIDPSDGEALADAMARIWREPSLREELVRRGREQRQRFSWEACARQVLATLRAVGIG